jgi:hypothetical protein
LRSSPRFPVALFPGKLPLAGAKYLCYVLDNGKRAISQREVVHALTGHAKGDISRYLDSQNLKPFISNKLVADQTIKACRLYLFDHLFWKIQGQSIFLLTNYFPPNRVGSEMMHRRNHSEPNQPSFTADPSSVQVVKVMGRLQFTATPPHSISGCNSSNPTLTASNPAQFLGACA